MSLSGDVQTSSGHGQLQDTLRLARDGSAEALGELLQGCRQYLLLVANEELEPALVAKTGGSDLVQGTFLAAQRHFLSFRGSTEAELLGWLRQILLHHLATLRHDYFGAGKRRPGREISLDGDLCQALQLELTADTGSPSSNAVHREEVQVLNQALNRLTDRHRLVIRLRHREQLPFEEVARRLELSVPAARQLWARAIKRLRRELKTSDF